MKQAKFERAAAFWGARAVWHLDHMRRLLEVGREDDAARAATWARLAAIYAATCVRIGENQ